MTAIAAWIETFRLRTLPLALSTIFLGSFLAAYKDSFQWKVLLWAVLTTLFLQILSNLANDYGDAVKGVDNEDRLGPKRSLQKGMVSLQQMKIAIIVFVLLSLVSGILLLVTGVKNIEFSTQFLFLGFGIVAIIAALKYTMGKNPYGYSGVGDIAVFIFFGILGVIGTYYLHVQQVSYLEFLPAMSIGFFSTGVLNLNNLRDRDNDAKHGKRTIVVKIGLGKAKIYHALLLLSGMLSAILFSIFNDSASYWQWIYLPSFIGVVKSIITVQRNENAVELYPELKKLAINTLIFSILFGVGLLL